jgi:hypothetical protein
MSKFFYPAAGTAAAAGALAVAWVASGYGHGNPLALAMSLLIAAFYGIGLAELWRFHQATQGLQRTLAGLGGTPERLADWLATVPAPLRAAVRLRVEDERGALPGPALTPYLAGLLVLLGMLGTFLGMVVTLQGTGLALERATDVQTMRDSLAAPVRGLGLAFGTSVAGVASSAMLGLVSALCRRQRAEAAQALEAHIAGVLQPHTRAHQQRQQLAQQQQWQQETLALQQAAAAQQQAAYTLQQQQAAQQAEQLPALVASLQALTASVGQSLQHSLAEGARLASATLQPAVQATMEGITRETAALHGHIAGTVQQQLDGLTQRFEAQANAWLGQAGAQAQQQAGAWLQALDTHQAQQQARQAAADEARLAAFSATLAQMTAQLEATGRRISTQAEAQARGTLDEVARLVHTAGEAPRAAAEVVAQLRDKLSDSLAQDQALLQERQRTAETLHTLMAAVQQQMDGLTQRFEQQASTWVGTLGTQLQQQTGALLQALHDDQARQQAEQAQADAQRLAAWTATLQTMADQLQQATGAMTAEAQAQARSTIDEVARLVHTAGEAPRAAAEVVAQLRDKLSASLAQDTALLEERSRIMDTLNTLLGAVQHTATEQKAAIDELVASSARWLQEAGARFTEKADAETARLEAVAAQLSASAVDVASLGEAFGGAVAQFDQSSQQMLAHLQRLDEGLAQAGARSDEQLAYYVAQAREVIDLSLLSQKQIVDDLQRLAQRAAQDSAVASPA